MGSNHSRLVFSTDGGNRCPKCHESLKKCRCQDSGDSMPKDGVVRVRREVKGRKGKPVTVIMGLPLSSADLKSLASALKQKCGCGGSAKEGQILIQGDKVNLIIDELQERGYTVKRAGG